MCVQGLGLYVYIYIHTHLCIYIYIHTFCITYILLHYVTLHHNILSLFLVTWALAKDSTFVGRELLRTAREIRITRP